MKWIVFAAVVLPVATWLFPPWYVREDAYESFPSGMHFLMVPNQDWGKHERIDFERLALIDMAICGGAVLAILAFPKRDRKTAESVTRSRTSAR